MKIWQINEIIKISQVTVGTPPLSKRKLINLRNKFFLDYKHSALKEESTLDILMHYNMMMKIILDSGLMWHLYAKNIFL